MRRAERGQQWPASDLTAFVGLPAPDLLGNAVREMTPTERRLRARIAALALHASGGTNTAPARARFLERFEREVDPERALPEQERQRRAEWARRLYFARLALASAQARGSSRVGKGMTAD